MATEYINKEKAVEKIWSVKVTPNASIFDALKRCIEEEIKHIPAADVAPVRRGKWEERKINTISICYICSECKTKWLISDMNYCPNCGADMRRSDNG